LSRIETIAEGVTRKRELAKERTRRYRLRLKGVDVPPVPPRSGFKQTAEHVEKRKRLGPDHYNWHGDKTTIRNGRKRAEKMYPHAGPCVECGAKKSERHHVDGDTSNNAPGNIKFLCRRCHMVADGRLARFINGTP
jgi:hypothetical protein